MIVACASPDNDAAMRARIDKVPLSFNRRRSRLCAATCMPYDDYVYQIARNEPGEIACDRSTCISCKSETRGAPHEERMENSLRSPLTFSRFISFISLFPLISSLSIIRSVALLLVAVDNSVHYLPVTSRG